MPISRILEPNSPQIFLGSHDTRENLKKNSTIRSHVLGPIKRPLTASNHPKHGKTLKNGNKTQVGRKSYLLELSKTRKSGVHTKPASRRTFLLLIPKPANGRISRFSREKEDLLSLETPLKPTASPLLLQFTFWPLLLREKKHYSLFCLL